MARKAFSTDVIVSCVAFYKLSNRLPVIIGYPSLVRLIAFMTGEGRLRLEQDTPLFLTNASFAGMKLIEQHPSLGEIVYPYETYLPSHYNSWIASICSTFGEEMIVESCEDTELTPEEWRLIEAVNQQLKNMLT